VVTTPDPAASAAGAQAVVGGRRRWSLSTQIVVGLAAGVAVGVFFGEGASVLQIPADAYVRLLQMTVLPYVTGSIISGLGGLNVAEAKALGLRVGAVMAALSAVALVAVFLFPLMFPPHVTASFFSTTLVQAPEPFDLLALYVPTNPFYSLANNIVPAVVVFSVIVGVALMSVPNKAQVIGVLNVFNAAVARAAGFVVKLTPYGVFAIAAVAAGTLDIDAVQRLQVFLVSHIAITLLLSLWVLPGLIAAVTPVPHGAVLASTRDALVMAFMTTSLFAVVPMIIEQSKALLREYAPGAVPGDGRLPEIIVPASYNFPHAGKLLTLSFVLFAAWFADVRIPATDYPRLAGMGLLALFGNVSAAVPFLLDMVRVPADTFQLFLAMSIVASHFGTLVAAMHIVAVALIGTCAAAGAVHVDGRRLFRFAAITLVLVALTIGSVRALFALTLTSAYDKDKVLAGMQMLRRQASARVFASTDAAPPLPAAQPHVIDRIRARHAIRVGFLDDSLPYAYVNLRGDLVGLDVEMAYELASDLGVGLELVRINRTIFDKGLDPALCDAIMSGVAVTAERAMRVLFSAPYLDETIGLIVPDARRASFASWDQIRAMRGLRVGVPAAPYFIRKVRAELPDVEVVPIARYEDIFAPHDPPVAAFVATAERGSAYTLLHPEFSVVVPEPGAAKLPLAYVVAGQDQEWATVLNTWIELKRKDGTIDALFAHWILGKDATPRSARWSIVHDVLHWTR
jgi:Na+/H+-dicarboxylate symporter/ABC-type amino acid transport substrate-binding protein